MAIKVKHDPFCLVYFGGKCDCKVLEWWQVIELATVRKLARLRAKGRV